ncbi:nuclear transport factor 2 family protein [Mycolicibacterium sp. Dal123E01]|uniref:nuclear transport factor 2 family protein n=1 Tax=Mycolicibacterium sp. Dal123E01 TaxID=3457578 RepID=UPI00403EC1B3
MTEFARHRTAFEDFIDTMHRGADEDVIASHLAENVVLNGPLGNEPLIGREAVVAAIRTVAKVATDLTYTQVLSGQTHHAAVFRLQIDDTVVDGMDLVLLDADGRIAEVTIWWRPLPAALAMQRLLETEGREHLS